MTLIEYWLNGSGPVSLTQRTTSDETMVATPPIGSSGGQRFDTVAAIRNILGNMGAGPGFCCGAVLVKELIQNADDAGASELSVFLDERVAPSGFPPEYRCLVGPALLVCNDKPFRKGEDESSDDFRAICHVAGGHKLQQATAAGRFGIGFNSVYFLTDTPIIFSRREVHVFDLLHYILSEGDPGWKFSLDNFRTDSLTVGAGPIKQVLEWALPKLVLGTDSFGEIAYKGVDYQQAVFRLPLRLMPKEGERLADETFTSLESRQSLLRDICLQAAQSLLFLKSVQKITISNLTENGPQLLATATVTSNPSQFEQFRRSIDQDFERFRRSMDEDAPNYTPSGALACEFYRRDIQLQSNTDEIKAASWSFFVKHAAQFDDPQLCNLRKRLYRNGERAIPWVSLAIPEDPTSLHFEGDRNPYWRVFLPLSQEGPCGCILNAHLFVDPPRHRVEFRTGESADDEALRKTEWNKALVDRALIPLLSNASDEMLRLIPEFVEKYPRDYLSLFPRVLRKSTLPQSLAEYLQQQFETTDRLLRLYDLWKEPLLLLFDKSGALMQLEMIPERLAEYGPLFKHLKANRRNFVTFSLGKALREYLSEEGSIKLRWDVAPDVVRAILEAERAPHSEDLESLLGGLDPSERTKAGIEGLWCFQRSDGKQVIKFDQSVLYLVGATSTHENLLKMLREIGLQFSKTEWVSDGVGLCALPESQRSDFDQLRSGDDSALLALLCRAENGKHDLVSNPETTKPLIAFLCQQSQERLTEGLKLEFLVTTATNKLSRRNLGTIFLKPRNSTQEDKVVWEGLLRGTFAEVEPQFAVELHRLLDHMPSLLRRLDAEDCRCEIATVSQVFGALSRAMVASRDAGEVFRKELNRPGEDKSPCRTEAYDAALLILEDADRRWDQLSEEEQVTVLSLPIHRLANGTLVSLLNKEHPTRESLRQAFFLQSEDDLSDAPVKLEERTLLHSVDRISRRFYRTRLLIAEQGRVEVLKQALRQVGTNSESAEALLVYVAKHYRDTIEQLKKEGSESQKDAESLRELYGQARLVPCLDGMWHRLEDSTQASVAADQLKRQGWKEGELDRVLTNLAHPRAVATLDVHLLRVVAQLDSLQLLSPSDLGLLAITSEAKAFGLGERAKIFLNNTPSSSVSVLRASVLESILCPALTSREVALKQLELLEISKSTLSDSLLGWLFPNAVDVVAIAKRLGVEGQEAARFLKALNVSVCIDADLDEVLAANFVIIWPSLNDRERFEILAYIGSKDKIAEKLRGRAVTLEVVKVTSGKWVSAGDVISPEWASTQPPVGSYRLATIADVPGRVLYLWNRWCGLNTIGQVVEYVTASLQSVPDDLRVVKWKEMVRWLKRVIQEAGAKNASEALKGQAWVLAKRGSEHKFQTAEETLSHPGADLLSREFWVVYGEIPTTLKEYVQFLALPADAETIEAIAKCLADAANFPASASLSVYQEVSRLIDQDEAIAKVWESAAERLPVYRLFRTPDSSVTSSSLFLGDNRFATDFGEILKCLSQDGMPDFRQTVRRTYKTLGLGVQPSPKQLLSALARTCGQDRKVKDIHRDLVDTLTSLGPDPMEVDEDELCAVGVLSCSGTYQPLGCCYRDEELNSPELIQEESRSQLIDGRDRPTSKLLKWIGDRPDIVKDLAGNADRVLLGQPEISQVSVQAERILQPWNSWLGQLANEDAVLRSEVADIVGLDLPKAKIEVLLAEAIRVYYKLRDGGVILPSSEWRGSQACRDSANRIFIAKDLLDGVSSDRLENLDRILTNEILNLLIHISDAPRNETVEERFGDLVRRTLERPSVVLSRMKKEKEEHVFHQYLDQAADPGFADHFDEYRQLSQLAPRRKVLSELMSNIISDKFVRSIRDTIRGYGYDEFSVFAELVQNAEDAYSQRLILEMGAPERNSLQFRYSTADGKRLLIVEHFGRPFNYWIHGAKSEPAYKRDVDGVLKSAGSFKPHAESEGQGVTTVGRFGLGFKSVYLITPEPIIHSGDWHFTIKSGCIPEEVGVPNDLATATTRFVLPLLDDAEEEKDKTPGEGARFVNLLPFLRQIDHLTLERSDCTALHLRVQANIEATLKNSDGGITIELVEVSGPKHVRGGTVDFIRLRSQNNDAQLAIYLGEDGLPASWKEAFLWDTFAVLPLRVELGCGVAVSHLFQVQSGRTHLIDPAANRKKVAEVSALIQAVPQALLELLKHGISRSDLLRRFWTIWRWDRGDNEASDLRRSLATELVRLAERAPVVPTLNSDEVVALDGRTLFCFEGVPEEFGKELLAAGTEVSHSGLSVVLRDTNVVPQWFLSAFDRTCTAAKRRAQHLPNKIDWSDIGRFCIDHRLLAEKPELVSIMARSLSEAEIPDIIKWLAECPLRRTDGGLAVTKNLLPSRFAGIDYLPMRLMNRLDSAYDGDAITLLKRAGLPSKPSVDDLETWIDADLQRDECARMIQYFADQGRWRRDFYRIGPKLRAPWFESGKGKITSSEAWETGLISRESGSDPLFLTWLGVRLGEGPTAAPEPPPRPELNTKAVLEEIYRWWSTNSDVLIRRYQARVYLDANPPILRRDFLDRNGRDRENWMVLLILGVTHTMGRTNPEQHREFLRLCKNQGWLDVFADPDLPAEKWMGVLESYLRRQTNEAIFFEWVKQFVSIFQLAHWLRDYVEAFLAINRMKEPFSLDSVTRLYLSETMQGGGPDGPSLTRTLGMGACFVVRELIRLNVLTSKFAYAHAYVPARRVRKIFERLGCTGIVDQPLYQTSSIIYHFLLEQFGDGDLAKVTFNLSFDIPFLFIAEDRNLQIRFFETELAIDDEEEQDQ